MSTTDLAKQIAAYQSTYVQYRLACDVATDPSAPAATRERARKRRRNLGRQVHRLRGELRKRGICHGEALFRSEVEKIT